MRELRAFALRADGPRRGSLRPGFGGYHCGLKSGRAMVEDCISKKAAHGVYAVIAIEQRASRANPSRYAGSLAAKPFCLIH